MAQMTTKWHWHCSDILLSAKWKKKALHKKHVPLAASTRGKATVGSWKLHSARKLPRTKTQGQNSGECQFKVKCCAVSRIPAVASYLSDTTHTHTHKNFLKKEEKCHISNTVACRLSYQLMENEQSLTSRHQNFLSVEIKWFKIKQWNPSFGTILRIQQKRP